MNCGYKTDIGLVRSVNEDRYLFVDSKEYKLLVVADGMGGHDAGDIASQMTIDEIVRYNLAVGFAENTAERLVECVAKANEIVYKYSNKKRMVNGMGTTLVIAVVIENKIYFANVGDSRGYIINNGIKKITIDHSYVEELLLAGDITPEEAYNHPNKNQITRAIGTNPTVKTDIFVCEKEKGDIVFLCSDGCTNMLKDEEILYIFKKSNSMQEAADTLVICANDNGGYDNVTVVCYSE